MPSSFRDSSSKAFFAAGISASNALKADILEALKDDRAGQHSMRINDRYRLCFVWENGDARDVEIVDYH